MKATRKLDSPPPKPSFWTEEDEREGLDRMVKKFSLISKSSKHQNPK